MRWTPARAARLGYLAGRGASLHTVLKDMEIGAASAQSLRYVATRWNLKFGREVRSGPQDAEAPPLAIPLPPGDLEVLEMAAQARGLSVASFTATLLCTLTRERLLQCRPG
jgi:hypothetical protein